MVSTSFYAPAVDPNDNLFENRAIHIIESLQSLGTKVRNKEKKKTSAYIRRPV